MPIFAGGVHRFGPNCHAGNNKNRVGKISDHAYDLKMIDLVIQQQDYKQALEKCSLILTEGARNLDGKTLDTLTQLVNAKINLINRLIMIDSDTNTNKFLR